MSDCRALDDAKAEGVKPCPYCAAKWENGELGLGYWPQPATHFFVQCNKCGARGPHFQGDSGTAWTNAAKAWNKCARP